MNPLLIIHSVAKLIAELLEGTARPEDAARTLIDTAIATGVPENVLASYLTAAGRKRAELAADVTQAAKLARKGSE